MLERRRTLILEVRDGLAAPESIALEEGRELEPTSLGTDGAWRVEGEGVLEVHAFLCFDGQTLFLQSVDEAHAAQIDGIDTPAAWSPLSPPSTITVGSVSIVYRSLSDDFDDETEADPPRAEKMPRPFAPGAFSSRMRTGESEATRLEVPRGPKPPAKPARAAAAPAKRASTRPPNDEPTRIEMPIVPRTPPRAQPIPTDEPSVIIAATLPPMPVARAMMPTLPPAEKPIDLPPAPAPPAPPPPPTGMKWVAAEWKKASGPKKALLLLMPFAIAAVYVIFRDEPRPPQRRAAPVATVASHPTATATATSTAIPMVTATPTATPSADGGGPTLERVAVDAVAAGSYAEAVRAYDQLAAAYPDRTAYAEAARILRAKLDAGR